MVPDRFYHLRASCALVELLDGLGIELSPEEQKLVVKSVSALDHCGPDQLVYFGGKKYRSDLETAGKAICLCAKDDAESAREAGLTPIVSDYARAAFATAIGRLYSKKDFVSGQAMINPEVNIHPSAKVMPGVVIGQGVQIGANVIVGPGSVIYPDVVIGEGTTIDANVTLQCVLIGKNCKIHSSACLGGDGFGVAATQDGTRDIPHIGQVVIGDNVSIGYGTMVDRGMLGDTWIKDGAKIDNLCQIAHNCTIGENTMIAGHTGISGTVHVGKNVLMGGRVGIADHLNIGDGAQLAASTLLMRDVPDGEVWAGFPAKPIRQYMREVATISRLAKPAKKKQ